MTRNTLSLSNPDPSCSTSRFAAHTNLPTQQMAIHGFIFEHHSLFNFQDLNFCSDHKQLVCLGGQLVFAERHSDGLMEATL